VGYYFFTFSIGIQLGRNTRWLIPINQEAVANANFSSCSAPLDEGV